MERWINVGHTDIVRCLVEHFPVVQFDLNEQKTLAVDVLCRSANCVEGVCISSGTINKEYKEHDSIYSTRSERDEWCERYDRRGEGEGDCVHPWINFRSTILSGCWWDVPSTNMWWRVNERELSVVQKILVHTPEERPSLHTLQSLLHSLLTDNESITSDDIDSTSSSESSAI